MGIDIQVPGKWPSQLTHSTMSPSENFSEMTPLFCMTEIPFDTIGEHIGPTNHVRELVLSKRPRRLLVFGIRVRRKLIATPLLKWDFEHGLEVTKIYEMIEYTPRLRKFEQEVTGATARLQCDLDPDKTIVADTMKLVRNTIMNLFRASCSIVTSVLKIRKPRHGLNRQFRTKHNGVSTYEQRRFVFTYFYCERRTLAEGSPPYLYKWRCAPRRNCKRIFRQPISILQIPTNFHSADSCDVEEADRGIVQSESLTEVEMFVKNAKTGAWDTGDTL